MAICNFMKSLQAFKVYMISTEAPNYVRRYCERLDKYEWLWFYEQMKEPMEFVEDTEYLFYILKWILKYDFDDLSYDVYTHYVMDPELCHDDAIKDAWMGILKERYGEHLEEEIISGLYDILPGIDENSGYKNLTGDIPPF